MKNLSAKKLMDNFRKSLLLESVETDTQKIKESDEEVTEESVEDEMAEMDYFSSKYDREQEDKKEKIARGEDPDKMSASDYLAWDNRPKKGFPVYENLARHLSRLSSQQLTEVLKRAEQIRIISERRQSLMEARKKRIAKKKKIARFGKNKVRAQYK